MSGSNTGTGQFGRRSPTLEQQLRYERQLEGETFTRSVLSAVARRRQRRAWVLVGAAASSVATTAIVRPEEFTFLPSLRLPVQDIGETFAALPIGGLLTMLLVSLLVVGVSKTIDSI